MQVRHYASTVHNMMTDSRLFMSACRLCREPLLADEWMARGCGA